MRTSELRVYLRAVEGAAALIEFIAELRLVRGDLERLRRLLPHGVVANRLFRPSGDVGLEVIEPEGLEHPDHETDDLDDLGLHLLGGDKDMRVVLGESPDPQE